MTARLTIAAARPGMRVRFPKAATGFSAGDYATIKSVTADGWVYVEGISGVSYRPALMEPVPEPTLAALLAERAPEFLAAVREWRTWLHGERVDGRVDATPQDDALLAAIEAAGILDKPAPSQPFHLTPLQFQEMHNAG